MPAGVGDLHHHIGLDRVTVVRGARVGGSGPAEVAAAGR